MLGWHNESVDDCFTVKMRIIDRNFARVAGAMLMLASASRLDAQMVGGPGPSIMSRGGNAAGSRGSEMVDFTFYAGVNAAYESGIYLPVINGQGVAEVQDFYNVGVNVGVYGSHQWRRSSLGVDYRGDYLHYPGRTYMNGSNHALGLEYRKQLSRRWQIAGREAAGTTSRAVGGFASPAYVAVDYISVPTTEIFNNRIYYTQTTAYAAYQPSARTMYTMSGGFFQTRRQSSALINSNGVYASGEAQRRVSRNTSVGGFYNYMKFTYPRIFGSTDIHGVSALMERTLGKSSAFHLSAGVYRVELLGTETFTLRPEIAAILGRPTGVRVFHGVKYLSQLSAAITYRRRQLSYNAGYTRGASPGNGVYLTSQQDTASAGVSYSGLRRASVGVNASYIRLSSLLPTSTSAYRSYGAGGGGSYNIGHGLNWTVQLDWRNLSAGQTILNRTGYVLTTGLSFASSPIPLSLW
jgi:hypothetical protein